MKKFFSRASVFFGILLFFTALFILHRELAEYHYHDIIRQLESLPRQSLLLAFLIAAINYLVLTVYETLAFRYISHPLRYWKIALTSFVSNVFNNNMGFAMLTGNSVRFRLYSAWGAQAVDITKVIVFYTITIWLGLLAFAGTLFLIEPVEIPKLFHLPFHSVFPIGVGFILILFGYLVWAGFGKSVKIKGFEFRLPPLRISFYQVVISSLDWALVGSILYVLLPSSASISFPLFLSVFLFAQISGLTSQIPGGFEVFETVMLLFLARTIPTPTVLGALLAYRSVYYWIPLGLAAALFGAQEILERRGKFKRLALFLGQFIPDLAPLVLTVTTFASGCILLFSGATPAVGSRLAWLKDLLPLPVMELSHFLGSLAGIGLIFLARGLQRRLDAAYFFTILLLAGGILFSLLKGFDYEEMIALTVMLIAVLPAHKHFYRKASFLSESITPRWIAAVAAVIGCTAWLGFFSFKHVDYSHDLWWRFTFSEDAPDF